MPAADDWRDQLKALVRSETDIEALRRQLSTAIMALEWIAFAEEGTPLEYRQFAVARLWGLVPNNEVPTIGELPAAAVEKFDA